MHAEGVEIGQSDLGSSPVGLMDRVLRVDLYELQTGVVADSYQVQIVERHEIAAIDDIGGVHREVDEIVTVDGSGESHVVVTAGRVHLAQLHRIAPMRTKGIDSGRGVANRAQGEATRSDAGPHDEADLHDQNAPTGLWHGRRRTTRTAGSRGGATGE